LRRRLKNPHHDQCQRISKKLKQAEKIDPNYAAFGAESHRYEVGPMLPLSTIEAFEAEQNITLPKGYSAFFQYVGHGSPTIDPTSNKMTENCAAGPYYGLFPLGKCLGLYEDNIVISRPPFLTSEMSIQTWEAELKKLDGLEDDKSITDARYSQVFDAVMGKAYAGILPIGHRGCGRWVGMFVAGESSGRAMMMDEEADYRPIIAPQLNFLDWYEAWLDGVLKGSDTDNEFQGTVYFGPEDNKM